MIATDRGGVLCRFSSGIDGRSLKNSKQQSGNEFELVVRNFDIVGVVRSRLWPRASTRLSLDMS
jgi:hypothetical protein